MQKNWLSCQIRRPQCLPVCAQPDEDHPLLTSTSQPTKNLSYSSLPNYQTRGEEEEEREREGEDLMFPMAKVRRETG